MNDVTDDDMKFRICLIIVLFLLFVQPVHAVFGTYTVRGVEVPDLLMNLANIIGVISFILIAMGYMIARSLDSPRLINMMQTELYQTIATLVILSVYMGGLSFMNSIGPALYATNLAYPGDPATRTGTPGDWVGVQQHTINYIQSEIDYLNKKIEQLGRFNVYVGAITSLTISMSVNGQSYYSSLFGGMGSLQQVMGMVLGMLATSVIQLYSQLTIMGMWRGFLNVLLPFGIALRMFPFTRSAGGAMIAIVFGFTFFLPVMYLIIEDVSSHYRVASNCTTDKLSLSAIMFDVGISSMASDMFDRINELFGPDGELRCVAFRAGIEAVMLPFFAYLMALNATRKLAELLGAEIELSTLVRFI